MADLKTIAGAGLLSVAVAALTAAWVVDQRLPEAPPRLLVVDSVQLLEEEIAQIARNADPQQARSAAETLAVRLTRTLDRYAHAGVLLINRRAVVAAAPELDATAEVRAAMRAADPEPAGKSSP